MENLANLLLDQFRDYEIKIILSIPNGFAVLLSYEKNEETGPQARWIWVNDEIGWQNCTNGDLKNIEKVLNTVTNRLLHTERLKKEHPKNDNEAEYCE